MPGFVIAAGSLWEMAHWTLQTDYMHIAVSGFVQGLGMGLIFIPMNASAFATLPPHLRTDGSSVLNLARSIGSSIGISIVTTFLARNLQVSHSDLAAHVTTSFVQVIDFSTIDRFQTVGEAAMRMIDAEVNRQAAMIAYVNDFYLMMWMTLAVVPFTFLMRRPNLMGPAQGQGQKPEEPVDLPH